MNNFVRSRVAAGLITWLGAAGIPSLSLAQTTGTAPATTASIPAQTAQGLETIAYSEAIQAMVFTLPLFITERERVQRASITKVGEGSNPLVAPINQIGHFQHWVTAEDKNLPISPNNDTLYSGAVMDLEAEPIILQTPDIVDRFFTVEITNAYIDNQPYLISSRANGGKAATLAIVGPNWKGTLPAGMQMLRVSTNIAMMGPRIRINGEDDVPAAVRYQNQITLTPLSDWIKGAGPVLAKAPAARPRPNYQDEFAYFRRMADLLRESPPLAQDAAAVELLKHIGLEAGKPFEPEKLLPQARAGLLRAIKDLPALRDGIRFSRGVETPNRSGSVCLNSCPREITETWAGCKGAELSTAAGVACDERTTRWATRGAPWKHFRQPLAISGGHRYKPVLVSVRRGWNGHGCRCTNRCNLRCRRVPGLHRRRL